MQKFHDKARPCVHLCCSFFDGVQHIASLSLVGLLAMTLAALSRFQSKAMTDGIHKPPPYFTFHWGYIWNRNVPMPIVVSVCGSQIFDINLHVCFISFFTVGCYFVLFNQRRLCSSSSTHVSLLSLGWIDIMPGGIKCLMLVDVEDWLLLVLIKYLGMSEWCIWHCRVLRDPDRRVKCGNITDCQLSI